MPITIGYLVFC